MVDGTNIFVGGANGDLYTFNGTSWTNISTSTYLQPTETIVQIDFKMNSTHVEGYLLTDAGNIYNYDASSVTPFTLLTTSFGGACIYANTYNNVFIGDLSGGNIYEFNGTSQIASHSISFLPKSHICRW